MSKVQLQLKITALVELDGGYYRNDNMAKIEELVQQHIRSMRILVQEGTTTPKPVPADIQLLRIIYETKD